MLTQPFRSFFRIAGLFAFVAPLAFTAAASGEPVYQAPNCTTDPSNPYCIPADQWKNPAANTSLTPAKVCDAITEILQNKSDNSKWMNKNCPGPAKDPKLAAALSPDQQNACRMWLTSQTGTVKDMCVAWDNTQKTQKNLLWLAGTNAAAALMCRAEYVTMRTAALAAAASVKAAQAGLPAPPAATGVKQFLLGAKHKPIVCMASAGANVIVEAVIATQLAKINKDNYLSMGQSVQSGVLSTGALSDPQQALKTGANLAAMGINATIILKVVKIITTKGLCTNADIGKIMADTSTKKISTSAQQKRCAQVFSEAKKSIVSNSTPSARTLASTLSERNTDDETHAENALLVQLLSELGNHPKAGPMETDAVSMEILRGVTAELIERAGA